jgi:hypothetical protein
VEDFNASITKQEGHTSRVFDCNAIEDIQVDCFNFSGRF